jgi:hypothetical protein
MKMTWQSQCATALGMSLAAVITVGAQTPTTPGQQTPATPGQHSAMGGQDKMKGSVTAIGCLQAGASTGSASDASGASSSAPGVAAKAADAGSFVLRNAKFSGAPGAGAASGAGASDTAAGAGQADKTGRAARELRLMAGPGVNLADHVGHQISVTGMMGPMAAPDGTRPDRPAPTAGQAATPDNPGATMAGRGPVLTVTSLSMVSATCPAGS